MYRVDLGDLHASRTASSSSAEPARRRPDPAAARGRRRRSRWNRACEAVTDTTRVRDRDCCPGDARRARPRGLVWRGTIAESRHRVQAVAVDDRRRRAGRHRRARRSSPRSARPPSRSSCCRWSSAATPSAGASPTSELAVMAASHTGSRRHLGAGARASSTGSGSASADLACGYHEPVDPRPRAKTCARDPSPRSPLYNNCSGKHAGMLALALAEGWPLDGLRAGRASAAAAHARRPSPRCCGLPAADVAVGGRRLQRAACSALPLAAMARGYARLAAAARDRGRPRARALARIRARDDRATRARSAAHGRLSTDAHGGDRRPPGRQGRRRGARVRRPARARGWASRSSARTARPARSGPAAVALLEHLGVLAAPSAAAARRRCAARRSATTPGSRSATLEVRLSGAEPRDRAARPVANSAADPRARAQEPPTR